MQITRTQIKQLPLGFTPTSDGFTRKQRRSKEYQKMIAGFYKQEALKLADQEGITLANCTIDEEGKVIHNPLLTNESTINTTTE